MHTLCDILKSRKSIDKKNILIDKALNFKSSFYDYGDALLYIRTHKKYSFGLYKKIEYFRNLHYEREERMDDMSKITEIISSKKRLEYKLDYICREIDNIKKPNLSGIDDLRYVLHKIQKNHYLSKKAEKSENLARMKIKLENKLYNYIRKSEKRYNGFFARLRNKIHGFGFAYFNKNYVYKTA